MNGLVALVGGAEHTPGCEATDRLLLRRCGLRHPEVAVLLAASPPYRQTAKRVEAQAWWGALGARARCAFAGEPGAEERAATLLVEADVIVLTGGRPWLLRRRLVGTAVGALVRERWRAGVPVAGSSAGAMLLAGHAWSLRAPAPLAPLPGLGLAPGMLVAPHAGRRAIDTSAVRTQAAHPWLEVIGIPDRTALVIADGGSRRVVGSRPLMAYPRPADVMRAAGRHRRAPAASGRPARSPGARHRPGRWSADRASSPASRSP